jgi:hypothetical protein
MILYWKKWDAGIAGRIVELLKIMICAYYLLILPE